MLVVNDILGMGKCNVIQQIIEYCKLNFTPTNSVSHFAGATIMQHVIGMFLFKYCLLAIRLEDTSVYNLICCLVIVSWKGEHPAIQSNVFLAFCCASVVLVSPQVGWDGILIC
jgi:uncharacterized membrane protein YhaH (DUF805 family)